MALFKKKDEDLDLEEDSLEEDSKEGSLEERRSRLKKIKDLNPENKRKRKEPPKPWGKFERLFVLITLLSTVVISGILALSARNFKLPHLPKLAFNGDFSSLNPFKEQVIVVGNKGNSVDQKKIENTKLEFKKATNDYSGLYAFYIYDINGDYYYGENYQDVMQAASLIKLPVMATVYKEAEKGNVKLSDYTEFLEAMGKRSDNEAFKKVISMVGRDKINRTILELGMINTSLEENTTTPEEVGLFFKKLYKGEILNEKNTKEFLEFLTDTIFEEWLRPGIPQEYKLAHKYGREVHVVNDAGIVLSQKPFVVVIMTDGVIEREADSIFPKLSKLLYDNHVK